MGRIGTTELLVILLIALVLFGGSRVAGLGVGHQPAGISCGTE